MNDILFHYALLFKISNNDNTTDTSNFSIFGYVY